MCRFLCLVRCFGWFVDDVIQCRVSSYSDVHMIEYIFHVHHCVMSSGLTSAQFRDSNKCYTFCIQSKISSATNNSTLVRSNSLTHKHSQSNWRCTEHSRTYICISVRSKSVTSFDLNFIRKTEN